MSKKGWITISVGMAMLLGSGGWTVSIYWWPPKEIVLVILALAGFSVVLFTVFAWSAGEFGMDRK